MLVFPLAVDIHHIQCICIFILERYPTKVVHRACSKEINQCNADDHIQCICIFVILERYPTEIVHRACSKEVNQSNEDDKREAYTNPADILQGSSFFPFVLLHTSAWARQR